MTPAERRTRLLRLLAVVEQQIREAEVIASDESLNAKERRRAAVQLDFRRDSAKRIEEMLHEPSGSSGP